MITGQTIRVLRAKHDISMKQLSTESHVAESYISQIENGLVPFTRKMEQKLLKGLKVYGIKDEEIAIAMTWTTLIK